jgi:hypothetical protein
VSDTLSCSFVSLAACANSESSVTSSRCHHVMIGPTHFSLFITEGWTNGGHRCGLAPIDHRATTYA